MEEILLSRKRLNIVSVILPLLMMVIFTFIMIRIKPTLTLEINWIIVFYVLFVYLIHEILHGLGFIIIGKAVWGDIKFIFNKKNVAPYCVCKDLILDKNQYIWFLLFPNIILSLLTLGFIINSNNIFWGIVMGYVVGCGSADYYMVFLAIKYPNETRFENHPKDTGFLIY